MDVYPFFYGSDRSTSHNSTNTVSVPVKLILPVILHCLLVTVSFGQQASPLLTAEEILWLQNNEINYAPNPLWAPGDFVDVGGIHRGIVADYIRIFEEELGISFNSIFYNNWNEMLNGIRNGDIDFIGAIQHTEDREEYMLFTEPYLNAPVVILTRNDYPVTVTNTHISEMTLAIPGGYASVDYIRDTYPQAEVEEYESDLEALLQTSFGNTDGVVTDLMAASYYVEKYGINNLQLGYTLDFSWQLRMGSRRDIPELNSILNKLLAAVPQSRRQEIYNRWVNIENIQAAGVLERNYQRLIYLTILISVVICAVIYHNRKLKRQVLFRTGQLEKELGERAVVEENLTVTLKEREVLLAEIHHRVKNNMAIISSLLQFEMLDGEQSLEPGVLENSVMRIKSMALIHENLYTSADFKSIPFHTYLNDLLVSIRSRFGGRKKIRIETDVEEVNLNINVAIPLSLLVNEVITNAYHHAFPGRPGGVIRIRLKSNGDEITLRVEDDGINRPDTFRTDNHSSVGLMLINVLSRQIKAKCDVESDSGTRYTFHFKNDEKKGAAGNVFQFGGGGES